MLGSSGPSGSVLVLVGSLSHTAPETPRSAVGNGASQKYPLWPLIVSVTQEHGVVGKGDF